jgi:hypothetical protein
VTDPVVFSDLSHEVAERLIDVDALFGRCLYELATKVLGKIAAL